MAWRSIDGYKYPYRISDQGEVQKWDGKQWITLLQDTTSVRVQVRLKRMDGGQHKVGVFRLLDKYFNGGYAEKNGLCVGPKNGMKTECTLENITYKTHAEIGRKSIYRTARKPVVRYDRHGNSVIYPSIKEAAKKNGMTVSSLDRRLYHGTLDPRGYRWEVDDIDGRNARPAGRP